jgi:hypothetical protein
LSIKKEGSLRIDSENGRLIINQQHVIQPYQSAQEFLDSELYRQYAFGKTTLQDLKIQGGNGHILIKVPDIKGYAWIFIFDFKNMILKSIVMNVVRKSMKEFAEMSANDFQLYCEFLKENFGKYPPAKNQGSSIAYKFLWGIIKVGTYPDGLVVKLIVRYAGQPCEN